MHMRKFLILSVMLMLAGVTSWAQRTITGRVTDANGNPVSGASVEVQNTRTGTVTKDDGTFTLTVPANGRTLMVSAVGQTARNITIGNQTNITVALQSGSQQNLQEVVVVGYGTQRRRDVTGNVSSVKGSEVAQKPVQSFEQALAGKAAGVQITVPNGVLNNPPVFRIRGVNSISLSSNPLIVVDGVVSYTGDQGGTSAPANPLASINPNDIESIDIAKDAASAAIYGSRAANGVVFITTKKGRTGKARVSYDGWVGFTRPMRLPELLNNTQYMSYKTDALNNLKAVSPSTTFNFFNPTDGSGNPINTNWLNEVYRNAVSHSHSVSISGGSEGTTYYLSTGYTKQEGILRGNDFERKNVLLNIDSRINNVVTVGGKLSYSNELNLIAGTSGSLPGEAFASSGAARLAFALPPILSPRRNDGAWNIASITAIGSQGVTVNGANPFTFNNISMLLALNRSNNEANHVQSNAYVQLKPVSWITLRTVYGVDNLIVDNDLFWNPYHGDGASATSFGPGGGSALSSLKNKTYIWTNTAQFDYSFANKHNFSLLVGNEQQRRTTNNFGVRGYTLSDSAYNVLQAGTTNYVPRDMLLGENYLLSSFGRLTYNYNQKYYLSGNIRQDEYSALGKKKGVFYGASAGWEIAKENFWSAAGLDKVFSNFKLRGSYGKVGNIAGINDFAVYSTYVSALYGGAATLGFSTVGNPDITWETSKKTDLGMEFGLFHNRFNADIAYYKNDVNGLLLNVPQSPSTGLTSIFQNVGSMYNKGVEISLRGTPVQGKDFTWNATFNFAYNKNEVTALANGLPEIIQATSSLESVNRTAVGYSAGYLWLVRSGGVDPATGKRIYYNKANQPIYYQNVAPSGQFAWMTAAGGRYEKTNADGSKTGLTINQADDAVMFGNTIPKVVGGFDNTFRYKNFDLNVLLTYQSGFYVYYGSYSGLHDNRFWNNVTDILDYWKKPGDNARWPKPIWGDNVSNGSALAMDINAFKGDFAKLKSVTLGYGLPQTLTSRLHIASLRAYVSAQNLAIITNYPGPDPEVASNGSGTAGNIAQGVDRNTLANGRTITLGVNLGF